MKKNNKIGLFICNLRKEKSMSQYDLADLIPIGREAVSKWERGITNPSKSCAKRLCEIFDISPEELLAGERFTKKSNKKNDIFLDMYEDVNNKNRKIRILIFSFLLLIVVFLGYILLNTYNTIKVYNISGENANFSINDGVLITTKDKIYFNIGNIYNRDKINSLKLYYLNEKNEHKTIYESDSNNVIIYDYYGYNELVNIKNSKQIINNLYLEINSDEIIKLNLKKDFSNNYLYFFNKPIKEAINEELPTNNRDFDFEILKDKAEKIDDAYIYSVGDFQFTYFENNLLIVRYIKEQEEKEWVYEPQNKTISFNEYQDSVLIVNFDYVDENLICNLGNCDKVEVDNFYNKINEILNN